MKKAGLVLTKKKHQ